ncbi:cytochrome c oxidase subunit 3 family protein [Spongiibacter sp. KMU-166]|uniref:Cytochrome c oxidase subunit 3 family protein n=2 Tax=Spongiibacter thalassae TaxID=2721624 RepID=A0ABX1GEA7_9GAMM|nr:cytochrome c oxidase subunit 3 family protein [Spongiibacter thalassae]
MLMFALLFGVYGYYRQEDIATFDSSQASLNKIYSVINTVLLLSSSLLVVLALRHCRRAKVGSAPILLLSASACGIAFLTLKIMEYREKFASGISLNTNEFFMYYFVLTGLHSIHVVIGIVILFYMFMLCRRKNLSDKHISVMESGASYWHMVDLLWIVIFPLLYLLN